VDRRGGSSLSRTHTATLHSRAPHIFGIAHSFHKTHTRGFPAQASNIDQLIAVLDSAELNSELNSSTASTKTVARDLKKKLSRQIKGLSKSLNPT